MQISRSFLDRKYCGKNRKTEFCLISLLHFFSMFSSLPSHGSLSLSQRSPCFYVSALQVKTLWKKEKLLVTSNFSFSTEFSTILETFLPFLSNLKLSYANSFSLEELKFVVWESVKSLDSLIKVMD